VELPLFPLNAVLFPSATMPLHIFEERYKQMIGMCLEERRPFGVLLIRTGNEVGEPAEPFEVGTTAHIVRAQHLPDGRLNLVCIGGQRFRVRRVLQSDPYLVGDVELLEAPAAGDAEAEQMADSAGALYAEYVRLQLALTNQWTRRLEMPSDPALLADFIGARAAASLWVKQRILEETSARTRLAVEIEILGDAIREITPRLEAARTTRWRGFGVMD
jgi:Lon protease-like protein